MSDHIGRVAELRGVVERQSKKLATSLITLTTVGSYIFIVALATDHRQLLEQKPALLPLINVSVPVTWFAAFAPIVILLLSANVIVNFARLHSYNQLFEQELAIVPLKSEREFQRFLVDTLPLSSSPVRAVNYASAFLSKIGTSLLPIIILILIQAKFLPSHSVSLTWLHRICIFLLAIISVLSFFMASSGGRRGRITSALSAAPMLLAVLFSTFVLTVPGELTETLLLRASPVSLVTEVATRPGGREYFQDRSGAPTPRPRRVPILTYLLLEAPDTPLGLRRNIFLPQENFVVERPTDDQVARLGLRQAWREFGRGISLIGRDLRYADLSGVDLRKADLRAAIMTGVDLSDAKLDFADLSELPKVVVSGCIKGRWSFGCRTVLDLADLSKSTFRYTMMNGASLNAVKAAKANFEGADLGGTDLNLADLRETVFAGSSLSSAKMIGADLKGALLLKSTLTFVKAAGADFRQATIAMIEEDQNYAADLTGTVLRNARIFDANLKISLVDARYAQILQTSTPSSTNTDWWRTQIWDPSDRELDELFSGVLDRQLKLDAISAMKKRRMDVSKTAPGTIDVEEIADADQAEVADRLLDLACTNGRGNLAFSLGLLRRISVYRADAEWERRDSAIFDNQDDPAINSRLAVWEKLERELADRGRCGSEAGAIRRHVEAW
ncbi:pentapeptide repeat-containing protein [Ensifer aridi]|uniref:pentapeptide repeat-containing protein n=1 Tax=Ensifer aridi TaxID=1708715 RepID=UPI0003F97CA9|nr:pentapeptide repeat-containing protein [Ensifer aridi]